MGSLINPVNYQPFADICTVALCIICIILMKSSYLSKKITSQIFVCCNYILLMAACLRVVLYWLQNDVMYTNRYVIYAIYSVVYMLLLLLLVLFALYLKNLVNMGRRHSHYFSGVLWVSLLVFSGMLIRYSFDSSNYFADESGHLYRVLELDPFMLGYLFYGIIIYLTLTLYKKRFITKINNAFLAVMVISMSMVALEMYFNQSTYTCVTYAFPIVAALFLFHYNSYDIDTGTLDAKAFDSYIKDMHGKDCTFICLYLKHMYIHKMDALATDFFHFNEKYFKNPITFRLRDEKMVLIYPNEHNLDGQEKIKRVLADFNKLYLKYKIDYKIVIMHSKGEFKTGDDYLSYNMYLEKEIPINSIHMENEDDIKRYLKHEYLIKELHDIFTTADLNDPRVLVYCQPVYSNKTHRFSTAEALMRLDLPETGIVFPDQFIPIAEEYEYIHVMSKIILNKTCKLIKGLMDEGKEITRVSVNFNISELLLPDFVSEVCRIVEDNEIPYNKIAIELTEGQKEKEFDQIKAVMNELGKLGIKFYLDDFGTSYSNFERIIELPFDIIKFDRTMTIMASKGGSAEKIVGTMSSIFVDTNFRILFEGIENDADEERCIKMGAQFLQGYKYSKPIPMNQLDQFLA